MKYIMSVIALVVMSSVAMAGNCHVQQVVVAQPVVQHVVQQQVQFVEVPHVQFVTTPVVQFVQQQHHAVQQQVVVQKVVVQKQVVRHRRGFFR